MSALINNPKFFLFFVIFLAENGFSYHDKCWRLTIVQLTTATAAADECGGETCSAMLAEVAAGVAESATMTVGLAAIPAADQNPSGQSTAVTAELAAIPAADRNPLEQSAAVTAELTAIPAEDQNPSGQSAAVTAELAAIPAEDRNSS